MRFPPPPSKYAVISETGGKAASLCRASSSSTETRSSRTRSKNLFSREQRDGKTPDLNLVFETWGRESCRPGKAEEAPKILGGGGSNFVRRQVSHTRERARYFGNVGRLVALAAPRLRRKVRRVRLNQNVLQWQCFRNVAKVLRFRIG